MFSKSLKVKSLEVKWVSRLLYFIGMFILIAYLFKYCNWVNGFSYLMISIFFLSVFDTFLLMGIWQRILHCPLPYLIHQLNVHFTSHITSKIHMTMLYFHCDALWLIVEISMTFIDSIAQWFEDLSLHLFYLIILPNQNKQQTLHLTTSLKSTI